MTIKQYITDNYEELKNEALRGFIEELGSEQIALRRLDNHPGELDNAINQLAEEEISAVAHLDEVMDNFN